MDLSAVYFDVLKDRLYTKAPRSRSRRSAQTAVWKITSALVRLLAPVLVFTTEEIWKMLPRDAHGTESVHRRNSPQRSRWPAESVRMWRNSGCGWPRCVRQCSWRWSRRGQPEGVGGLEAKVRLHAGAETAGLLKLLQDRRGDFAGPVYCFAG